MRSAVESPGCVPATQTFPGEADPIRTRCAVWRRDRYRIFGLSDGNRGLGRLKRESAYIIRLAFRQSEADRDEGLLDSLVSPPPVTRRIGFTTSRV